MARYDNATKAKLNPEQAREAEMQAKLAAGEVVQMQDPARGLIYVTNQPKYLALFKRRGCEEVEYQEEVVRKPVAKAKEAKASSSQANTPRRRKQGD